MGPIPSHLPMMVLAAAANPADLRAARTQMAVSLGPTEGNPSEAADYVGTYVFLFPFKFAVSPVLDGAGEQLVGGEHDPWDTHALDVPDRDLPDRGLQPARLRHRGTPRSASRRRGRARPGAGGR